MQLIWISIITILLTTTDLCLSQNTNRNLTTVYKKSIVKCYVCDSNFDPKCADPFDLQSNQPEECSLDRVRAAAAQGRWFGTLPVSYQQKVEFGCQKLTSCKGKRVIRQCQIRDPESKTPCSLTKYQHLLPSEELTFCNYCEEDNCNGVGVLRAVTIPLICLISGIAYYL